MGAALRASGYDRSKYYIATKVSESYLEPTLLKEHLDASLARIGVDCIDLYQLHWCVARLLTTCPLSCSPVTRNRSFDRACNTALHWLPPSGPRALLSRLTSTRSVRCRRRCRMRTPSLRSKGIKPPERSSTLVRGCQMTCSREPNIARC